MEYKGMYIWILSVGLWLGHVEGGCNWPTEFQGATFYDNTRDQLTFTTTLMSGFSFTAQSTTIQNWECLDETLFASDKILLLKATDTFEYLSNVWVSYLCLKFTEVSAGNSYYYYQWHDKDASANDERVHIIRSTDPEPSGQAGVCTATSVPNAAFHYMVKSSAVSSAKQYCPPALLAKMGYQHTAAPSTVTCDVANSNWDVCTDRQIMTFNYTACSTEVASSTGGVLWCMANITSTHQYAVAYNTDSSPTKRFSCFVVNSDGTKASVAPDYCREAQTPTTMAQDGGSDIGALLTMSATETCPFLGPTTAASVTTAPAAGGSTESESSIIPIVVGALVGVIAVALIVAVTVICIKKKKRISHGDKEKQRPPDGVVGNGHTPGMAVEEVDNPALTVNPERNTLTPLPDAGVPDTTPRALPPISKPDQL